MTSDRSVRRRALVPHGVLVVLLAAAAPVGVLVGAAAGVWPSVLDAAVALAVAAGGVLGVTVGYHRLLTHRSFATRPWVRDLLLLSGATTAMGRPVTWALYDRAHHARDDRPAPLLAPVVVDPRSAPGFTVDVRLARVDAVAPVMVVLGLLLPAVVGLLAGGPRGAATAFLWAGVVRIGVTALALWAPRTVGHMVGEQPFTGGTASNVPWLALVTAGDCWHNSHHAFPQAARHGVDSGQWDPSADFIALLERVGLAWDVHETPPGDIDGARVELPMAPLDDVRDEGAPERPGPGWSGAL